MNGRSKPHDIRDRIAEAVRILRSSRRAFRSKQVLQARRILEGLYADLGGASPNPQPSEMPQAVVFYAARGFASQGEAAVWVALNVPLEDADRWAIIVVAGDPEKILKTRISDDVPAIVKGEAS